MIRNETEYHRTFNAIEQKGENLKAEQKQLRDAGFSSAEIKRVLAARESFRQQREEEVETYKHEQS